MIAFSASGKDSDGAAFGAGGRALPRDGKRGRWRWGSERGTRLLCLTFLALASGCDGESTTELTGGPSTTSETTSNTTTAETVTTTETDTTTTATGPKKVLLFSRTTGFRHSSIEPAVAALKERATAEGWEAIATEDPSIFTEEGLADIGVVAFVLTSGDVLDPTQQQVFESFISKGGGFFGVHSATDTEYDWAFYGGLVGAYFKAHPAIQQASIRVERPSHASTHHLPPLWARTDEWYAFQKDPRADVVVLLSLDESSYATSGTAMGDHPIAWYRGYGGGRAFYTALGHTEESWAEPDFLDHVWGGIEWAGGKDWDQLIVSELDGVEPVGAWERLQPPTDFPFTVEPSSMFMDDVTGANQHVVRQGVTLEPDRPYAMEALFRIAPGNDGLNSFCFDLNLDASEVAQNRIDSWAMNVDLGPTPGSGVMKHMGFVDGGFAQIGETVIDWGYKDHEYLLRTEVHINDSGLVEPQMVTTTVLDQGVVVERFTVDYSTFPYQPPAGQALQIGANTHGTDWWMRSLRVYYLDGPP